MALITVNLKIVSPYGEEDTPTPVKSGKVTFTPVGHGKYGDALRTVETLMVPIVGGDLQYKNPLTNEISPLELTPGVWKVLVAPMPGPAWPEMKFTLVEGMEEPVNLAVLAPEISVGATQLAKGDPGPTIVSWEDNGDGTITFIMSDGTRVGPGALPSVGEGGGMGPPGPAGEDGPTAYEVAVANGFVGTEPEWLESLQGDQGVAGIDGKSAYQVALDEGFIGSEAEWITSLRGEQGPVGDQGPIGPVGITGPAPELVWDGTALGIDGGAPVDLKGDKGDPGADGAQGIQGERGLDGTPGADGEPGEPGQKGDKGEPGDPGQKGDKGEPGEKGDPGADGAQGIQGEPGQKGDPGERGADGVTPDISGLVQSSTVDSIWVGTQAQYDALTPAADTLYIIKEA